jgi:AcrR family transcriptional regulator
VLTHYFPDKDALIKFSLEDSLNRFEQRLLRTVSAGAAALRATLEQVLPLDKERRTQWTVWLAFWGQAVGSKTLSAEQRKHYRSFRAMLEHLVQEGIDSGRLRTDLDPTDEADRLLALVEGISFQAVFDPQRWPRERQLSMVDDHLTRLSTGVELARGA